MILSTRAVCGLVFPLALCGFGFSPAADASRDSVPPDPVEWVKQSIQQANGDLSLGDVSFSFVITYPPTLSNAQREALRERIKGHPDHPDRSLLEQETLRSRGLDGEDIAVWYRGPAEFRLSRTPLADKSAFTEMASSSGNTAWAMTPAQLTIVDSKSAPPGRDYAQTAATVEYYIGSLFYGGLRFNTAAGLSVEPVSSSSGTARVRVSLGEAYVKDIDLRVTPDGAGYEVTGQTVARSDLDPTGVGSRVEFDSWHVDQHLDKRVPGVVRRYNATGVLTEVWSGVEWKTWTSAEVGAILAAPDPTGIDPIRGKVAVTSVYDLRPNAMELLERATPDENLVRTEKLPGKRAGTLRAVGWAAFAAMLVLFVWLRARRGLPTRRNASSHG